MLTLSETRFDPQMTALAIANSKQSFIKHILTEADRMAVTVIYPLENQGGYAVAMNYGKSFPYCNPSIYTEQSRSAIRGESLTCRIPHRPHPLPTNRRNPLPTLHIPPFLPAPPSRPTHLPAPPSPPPRLPPIAPTLRTPHSPTIAVPAHRHAPHPSRLPTSLHPLTIPQRPAGGVSLGHGHASTSGQADEVDDGGLGGICGCIVRAQAGGV